MNKEILFQTIATFCILVFMFTIIGSAIFFMIGVLGEEDRTTKKCEKYGIVFDRPVKFDPDFGCLEKINDKWSKVRY